VYIKLLLSSRELFGTHQYMPAPSYTTFPPLYTIILDTCVFTETLVFRYEPEQFTQPRFYN